MYGIITFVLGASQVFSTGSNRFGKLGLHDDEDALPYVSLFSPLSDLNDKVINRVHIGLNHAFATDKSNKLYGWGDNSQGQLAFSTDEPIVTYPKIIPYFSDKKIKYCDGGETHSVAIDYDGHIYTFGSNSTAQLGRTTGDKSPSEIDSSVLPKGEHFKEVHTNMETVYALTDKGNLYVWGSCSNAACPGLGESPIAVPTRIKLDFEVSNFFVGIYSVFVVDADGNVYGFGDNRYGQLCMEVTDNTKYISTVSPVHNIFKPRNIQASYYHSLFLVDGQVFACGSGKDGELGGDMNSIYTNPTLISGSLPNAISIAATAKGTFILSDGALYATGKDTAGELGYGKANITYTTFQRISTNNDLHEITKVVAHFNYAFMYAEHDDENSGLPTWAIVLIVIGCVCVVGGLIALTIWCIISKKKQPRYNFISEEKNKLVFNDDQW